MNTSTATKNDRAARLRQAIAGIQKYFLDLSALTLAGVSYTPKDLIALFQAEIDAAARSSQKKADWRAEVQAERAKRKQVNVAYRPFRNFVFAKYGDTPAAVAVLAEFGLEPRKVPEKPAKVKAGAADKANATRAAHGTKGKRQKAEARKAGSPAPAQPPAPTKA